ncbi:hypothetical protein SAMN05216480_10340 [Pustulibacterium marinum]|uniref:Uncharacterized protein n=2 Tax=Pustulibacterium marinum TaxID=1224947 RepID=A0A1I7G194_9FLAO|nr:hypothetical protein SAMN05216480_10340 [Pustulibacterium marinum]
MNLDMIDLLLANSNSYMEVSKDLFIKELSKKFKRLNNQGVTKFNKVSKGTCQKCYAGCTGYTFLTKNNDYLDLLIEEKNNTITDITQCTNFKNEEEIIKKNNIFLCFKKDLKTSYIPTSLHLSQQKGIEHAELEFEKFQNQIIDLEIIEIWLNKWSQLFNSIKYMNLDYSFVSSFLSTYHSTKNISSIKKDNFLAKKALAEFNNFQISDHKKLINWLLKYKKNQVYNASSNYTKTENWNKTNLIIFKNREDIFNDGLKDYNNIIIDIKGYLNSIKFGEIYSQYYYEFYNEIKQRQEIAQ